MTVIELGFVLLGVVGGGFVGHHVHDSWSGTVIGAVSGYAILFFISWLVERGAVQQLDVRGKDSPPQNEGDI